MTTTTTTATTTATTLGLYSWKQTVAETATSTAGKGERPRRGGFEPAKAEGIMDYGQPASQPVGRSVGETATKIRPIACSELQP